MKISVDDIAFSVVFTCRRSEILDPLKKSPKTFFQQHTVFKISAGPRTLTGKIVVGPTEALTLVVRRSGNNFHGTVIPTNTVPHFKPYIHPHSIVYFSAIRFLSLSSWFVSVKLAILRCNGSWGWPLTASEKNKAVAFTQVCMRFNISLSVGGNHFWQLPPIGYIVTTVFFGPATLGSVQQMCWKARYLVDRMSSKKKILFWRLNTSHLIILMISVVLCKINEKINYLSIFHDHVVRIWLRNWRAKLSWNRNKNS